MGVIGDDGKEWCHDPDDPEAGVLEVGSPQWRKMWARRLTQGADQIDQQAGTPPNDAVTDIRHGQAIRCRQTAAELIEEEPDSVNLETRLTDLFYDICIKLTKRVVSFQVMPDDYLVHRRDRTSNDLHAFLDLNDGRIFHLRAYTRHMLDAPENLEEGRVMLTGYLKDSVQLTGGTHSFKQKWYDWDAEFIAQEIVAQNPELFS
ncbi:hypothetical protein ACFL2V_09375 [Pseudomonadota bacterium]